MAGRRLDTDRIEQIIVELREWSNRNPGGWVLTTVEHDEQNFDLDVADVLAMARELLVLRATANSNSVSSTADNTIFSLEA